MIKHTGKVFLLSFVFCNSSHAIDPVYNGTNGILEQVFRPNCLMCHSSELVGVARNDAPFRVDFDIYERAKSNGEQIINESVDLPRMPPKFSRIPLLTDEQKAALLAWQSAGYPEFATEASYDVNNAILNLPLVLVDDTVFQASLRLLELQSSPLGFGFELISASLTDADFENLNTGNLAVYDTATGKVTLPKVTLSNGADDVVSATMSLIMNSNPLQFSLDQVESKSE